jgi:hypothetical protein
VCHRKIGGKVVEDWIFAGVKIVTGVENLEVPRGVPMKE